ncbi:MAG TPA: ferredoxin--NADP reductase [Chitinophagaceae bacterium]|nr:ferredoxin--NADP reductase [Chitinophagaceae bacterium]
MPGYLDLVIRRIIRETHRASTLILEPSGQQEVNYRSGQFLTLLFSLHGTEIRRSFSLSSSPLWDEPLSITIGRKINGEISRYILDRLRQGDRLRSLQPAGLFTLDSFGNQPRDIFLFGAGSGIVPLYSHLKTLLRTEPQSRIILIYSNSHQRSVIFLNQLRELEKGFGTRFRCLHILSQPPKDMEVIGGHLNNGLVEQLVTGNMHFETQRAVFLVCGPSAYMRMVQLTLRYMGFARDRIRKENFVVEPLPLPPATRALPATVRIISGHEVGMLTVPPHTTILQAALDQGIPIPYSCRGGVCSTCICRLLHGRILMTVNEVLTDKDREQGWILTCTGYPLDNEVVLELADEQYFPG